MIVIRYVFLLVVCPRIILKSCCKNNGFPVKYKAADLEAAGLLLKYESDPEGNAVILLIQVQDFIIPILGNH